jgi:Ca2+-binding EF-hand superfamily protein
MSNAGKTVTPQEIEGMIQEVDSSKDGRISF